MNDLASLESARDEPTVSANARAKSAVSSLAALASDAEWHSMGSMIGRLKAAILEIPLQDREEIVREAARCIERVQTVVLTAKQDTSEKLGEIRKGRVASRAYRSSQASTASDTLR